VQPLDALELNEQAARTLSCFVALTASAHFPPLGCNNNIHYAHLIELRIVKCDPDHNTVSFVSPLTGNEANNFVSYF
jgi:hypothetical protein